MAILVKCQCGREFRAKDPYRGRKTSCPQCSREIVIEGERVRDHDVFISYSKQDKAIADAICAALEAGRTRCWIAPRDIPKGTTWADSIMHGIADCRVMVLVFSSSANRSKHVLREVEQAVSKEVTIIPFRIEAVEPSGGLAYYVSVTQWLDALTPPLQAHIEELREQVRRVLSGAPESAKGVSHAPKKRRRDLVPMAVAAVALIVALIAMWQLRLLPKSFLPSPAPSVAPAPDANAANRDATANAGTSQSTEYDDAALIEDAVPVSKDAPDGSEAARHRTSLLAGGPSAVYDVANLLTRIFGDSESRQMDRMRRPLMGVPRPAGAQPNMRSPNARPLESEPSKSKAADSKPSLGLPSTPFLLGGQLRAVRTGSGRTWLLLDGGRTVGASGAGPFSWNPMTAACVVVEYASEQIGLDMWDYRVGDRLTVLVRRKACERSKSQDADAPTLSLRMTTLPEEVQSEFVPFVTAQVEVPMWRLEGLGLEKAGDTSRTWIDDQGRASKPAQSVSSGFGALMRAPSSGDRPKGKVRGKFLMAESNSGRTLAYLLVPSQLEESVVVIADLGAEASPDEFADYRPDEDVEAIIETVGVDSWASAKGAARETRLYSLVMKGAHRGMGTALALSCPAEQNPFWSWNAVRANCSAMRIVSWHPSEVRASGPRRVIVPRPDAASGEVESVTPEQALAGKSRLYGRKVQWTGRLADVLSVGGVTVMQVALGPARGSTDSVDVFVAFSKDAALPDAMAEFAADSDHSLSGKGDMIAVTGLLRVADDVPFSLSYGRLEPALELVEVQKQGRPETSLVVGSISPHQMTSSAAESIVKLARNRPAAGASVTFEGKVSYVSGSVVAFEYGKAGTLRIKMDVSAVAGLPDELQKNTDAQYLAHILAEYLAASLKSGRRYRLTGDMGPYEKPDELQLKLREIAPVPAVVAEPTRHLFDAKFSRVSKGVVRLSSAPPDVGVHEVPFTVSDDAFSDYRSGDSIRVELKKAAVEGETSPRVQGISIVRIGNSRSRIEANGRPVPAVDWNRSTAALAALRKQPPNDSQKYREIDVDVCGRFQSSGRQNFDFVLELDGLFDAADKTNIRVKDTQASRAWLEALTKGDEVVLTTRVRVWRSEPPDRSPSKLGQWLQTHVDTVSRVRRLDSEIWTNVGDK